MASIELIQSLDSVKRELYRIVEIYNSIEIDESPDLRWVEVDNDVDIGDYSSIVATDSSFIGRNLRIAHLYLIQASSLTYLYTPNEGFRIDWERSIINMVTRVIENIGIPDYMESNIDRSIDDEYRAKDREIKYRRRIIHHISKDLEVEITRKNVERLISEGLKPSLVMMDGSLNSFLALRFKRSDKLSEDLKRSWKKRVRSMRDINSLTGKRLVFISKLTTLQPLAYMLIGLGRIRVGDKVIPIPDYIIIEKILKKRYGEFWKVPGFLKPLVYINRDTGDKITITYSIFSRGGPIFQISMFDSYDEDSLREIVAGIGSISPSGYPEPLRQAHHSSKLSYRDIDQLLSSYDLLFETGREVLE